MIKIEIDGNTVLINVDEEGRSFQKITDLNTLRSTVGLRDNSYDSGFLPGRYGTKRIFEDGQEKKVLYLEPPRRRTVYYSHDWYPDFEDPHGYTEVDYENVGYGRNEESDDEEYREYIQENWESIRSRLQTREGLQEAFDIMLPSAVLIVKKQPAGTRGVVSLFTTGARTFIDGSEPLYEFPTPNIYARTGNICWGYNEVHTDIENTQTIQGVLPKFLSSPFNRDLSYGRVNGRILDIWRRMRDCFEEGWTEEEVLNLYQDDRLLLSAERTVNDIW